MSRCYHAVQLTSRTPTGCRVAINREYWTEREKESSAQALVLALPESDLAGLYTDLPATPVDRGVKHRARTLASYLQGRSGLMRLRTVYTNPGQALRGLRALPGQLDRHAAAATCLITLRPEVFQAIWNRMPVPQKENRETQPNGYNHALLEALEDDPEPAGLADGFLGTSKGMQVVRKLIARAARTDHNVLVLGETGSGKEIVAAEIHRLSPRCHGPYIIANCGAFPMDLIASLLFGHDAGTFSGATTAKKGLWKAADGGTLVLDEVGELSLQHQVALLRVLENGAYLPLGRVKEEASNARVIAATNRDLRKMVDTGRFRADLYFRLNTLSIQIPPLRERLDDVPLLANHFWHSVTAAKVPDLPLTVTRLLETYSWPGNVRELKTFLIQLQVWFGGHELDPKCVAAVMEDRFDLRRTSGLDG